MTFNQRYSVLLLAILAIAFPREGNAASITYFMTPISLTSSSGEIDTLTGTITTNGTIGVLAPSDVTSWGWTILDRTGGIVFQEQDDFSYFTGQKGIGMNNLVASSGDLSLPWSGNDNGISLLYASFDDGAAANFAHPAGVVEQAARYGVSGELQGASVGVDTDNPDYTTYSYDATAVPYLDDGSAFVIATAIGVPEPPSIVLASLAMVACGALTSRTKRVKVQGRISTACNHIWSRVLTRKSLNVLFLAIFVVGIPRAGDADSITYSMTPISFTAVDGVGVLDTLTGTITTDGALGVLAPSDITSWGWTLSDPAGGVISQEQGDFSYFTGQKGVYLYDLVATSGELALPWLSGNAWINAQFADGLAIELQAARYGVYGQFEAPYVAVIPFADSNYEALYNPLAVPYVDDGSAFVIATAVGVPEPASIVLATMGIVGVLLALRRSNRDTRLTRSLDRNYGKLRMNHAGCAAVVLFLVCSFVFATNAWCDTLYVSEYGSATVESYSLDGTDLGQFATTGAEPHGIAFDASQNVYVGSLSQEVEKYSPTGALLEAYPNPGVVSGVAFDQAGNLYASNNSANLIEKFSPTGTDLGAYITTGISAPTYLVFDTAGDLYVANYGLNNIERFSPTGIDLGVFADTGLNGPQGAVFDAAGNLYVANCFANTVEKFSPTGADLGAFISTGLNFPQGLALDSAGNFYVANFYGGTIEKYSSTGVDLGTFASGLDLPTGIAILSVPEPGTSLLMLAGLAALFPRLWAKQRRCRAVA